jgi:hypothetical protein
MKVKKIEWVDKSSDMEKWIGVQYLSGKVNGKEIFEVVFDGGKSENYKLYFLSQKDLILESNDIDEIFQVAETFFLKWMNNVIIETD